MKFENIEVFNFKGAIRGMRNPLESWGKSDSETCFDMDCRECCNFEICSSGRKCTRKADYFCLGVKDK